MKRTALAFAVIGLMAGGALIVTGYVTASETKQPASEHEGSHAKEEGSQPKSGVVHDAIELTRDVIKTERKTIIAATLDMTADESEAFWPVYREYETDLARVNDGALKIIKDFAKSYDTLTDEQATQMVKDFLKVKEDQLKVKRSHLKKFEKVLPPKKVARLYQVENKIEAAIQYEMAAEIPLVR